ncbi:MAG: hypothetical protein WC362_06615 [Methanoregula sp.]
MTFLNRIPVLLMLFITILLPCAAGAVPLSVNASLSADTVTPDTPISLTGTIPDNATQLQVWSLVCYKVIGVMSIPASCGADVTTTNVTGTSFVYSALQTAEPGTYTVIAAFPGPDGTFGIGYEKDARTLYYTANKTVIANWSRSNPSDREEAAVITKAMAGPGIENPSSTFSYTVEASNGTQKASSTATMNATPPQEHLESIATSAAPSSSATQSPGFGITATLVGMVFAAVILVRIRH